MTKSFTAICSSTRPRSLYIIRNVNPDMGYASFADAGGSTIGLRMSRVRSPWKASIAALAEAGVGSTKVPPLFCIDATVIPPSFA